MLAQAWQSPLPGMYPGHAAATAAALRQCLAAHHAEMQAVADVLCGMCGLQEGQQTATERLCTHAVIPVDVP